MRLLFLIPVAALATAAAAEPVVYDVDPRHTYPSFEADHAGGLSNWRGKINETSGRITLDRAAQTGSVEMTMNMASIDFGLEEMNEHARSPDIFDVAKYPTAVYKGTLAKFESDRPTEVNGELTLRGVTKPLTLTIGQFLCKPVRNVEVCGADATATLKRTDFGVDFGTQAGFKPEVTLRIQVEARRAGAAAAGR